jgi:predicted dithiol-disulfide oxidoreductase (DUF899 family)
MAHDGRSGITNHPVVSREQWLKARTAFLAKEKEHSRRRDELARDRRALPWVKIETPYVFDGPRGKETLVDLFEGRSQLVVYHFMFAPEWEAGCKHCSFWADNFGPIDVHLRHRDVTLVVVSRTPLAKIRAFQARMGWTFKWVSSLGSDFNYDFHVSFRPEELGTGAVFYNYARTPMGKSETERQGVSVFYKDARGDVFHTYSCYARGIDTLNAAYEFIDLTPRGRDEGDAPQSWVRHHDRYED